MSKTHEQKKQAITAIFNEVGRSVIVDRMRTLDGEKLDKQSLARAIQNGRIPSKWYTALCDLAGERLDGELFGMLPLQK